MKDFLIVLVVGCLAVLFLVTTAGWPEPPTLELYYPTYSKMVEICGEPNVKILEQQVRRSTKLNEVKYACIVDPRSK